jgi:hypothetical protein
MSSSASGGGGVKAPQSARDAATFLDINSNDEADRLLRYPKRPSQAHRVPQAHRVRQAQSPRH